MRTSTHTLFQDIQARMEGEKPDIALDVISYVGCVLSIGGLLVAIVTLTASKYVIIVFSNTSILNHTSHNHHEGEIQKRMIKFIFLNTIELYTLKYMSV